MHNQAYINKLSAFLPHAPVGNEEMEDFLGMVGGKPSRARKRILKSNGILTRHYALDPRTKQQSHTNAQLTAEAIRGLGGNGFSLSDIECLSCGTSSPDQIVPSHGVMVHGELENPPCEVVTLSGICASGVAALKYAYLSILSGQTSHAVATGSELTSNILHAKNFRSEAEAGRDTSGVPADIAFEKDFLRWMLSDGAGAMLLQARPNDHGLSLRIDWIEQRSYANELEPCMYAGAVKTDQGRLIGWREFDDLEEGLRQSVFSLKQDMRLLNEKIVYATVERGLSETLEKHHLGADEVDYFLPHYSSEYFRDRLHEGMKKIGFDISQEKWFTNLSKRGNVGSASIYLMLEELFNTGRLREGERLLCFVPESGRFSTAYMLLTVVAANGGEPALETA